MNKTDEPNVSIDQNFKSNAYARLVETGERDRMRQDLQRKLSECGWTDQLKKYCAKVVKERGVNNITLDDLLNEVTPMARKNVPDALRKEPVAHIRAFLMKEMGR
jgi:enhancer of yellow 2 transcription factor